jgi:hypothetical protein
MYFDVKYASVYVLIIFEYLSIESNPMECKLFETWSLYIRPEHLAMKYIIPFVVSALSPDLSYRLKDEQRKCNLATRESNAPLRICRRVLRLYLHQRKYYKEIRHPHMLNMILIGS